PNCRGNIGLRAAAKEIGVCTATLSRVENGHPTSVESFARICRWMGTSADAWLQLYGRSSA
ncbi:hypothetical protein LCGC14_2357530, partial [marine sediment metagenome]